MKTKTLLSILMLVSLLTVSILPVKAVKHIITQTNFSFSPSNLTGVHVGDTITWVWTGGSHTTTSSVIPAGAATWDSPLSSGNPTFTYIPQVEGEYEYVCTPHESMGMVGNFEVSSPATGLASYTGPSVTSFSLAPNPVCQDHCLLQINAREEGDITVKVFNMLGEELVRTGLSIARGNNSSSLDLSNLRQGVYFVQLWEKGKKTETIKIIKK